MSPRVPEQMAPNLVCPTFQELPLHRTDRAAQHCRRFGYQTYSAVIAIRCLRLYFELLQSNYDKVVRVDGTLIEAPRGIHQGIEALEMWHSCSS